MYLSKDFLERCYVVERQSLGQIGRATGHAASHIRKMLLVNGIVPRSVSAGVRARYPVPVGARFGKLVLLGEVDVSVNRKRLCDCRCDCGAQLVVPLHSLKSGDRLSCGCAWKRAVGEMPGDYLYTIRFHARKRNLPFTVTPGLIWALFLRQKRRCALSGLALEFFPDGSHTASLDRIDPALGYVPGNVQWLHKDVNRMKWDLPQTKFVNLAVAIASFNGFCPVPAAR